MNLQESIKRILREETQGETPVEVILNTLYPNFNKENASIKYVKSKFNRDVITYDDPETGYPFCSYWIDFRELTLEYELYETLEKYLNQDTFDGDLLNWFNSEFNKDEMDRMKEICFEQDSENTTDMVSFDVCDLLEYAKPEVEVTGIDNHNDKPVIIVKIKVSSRQWYKDEESFVDELERRLIKWIGNNIIEVEDMSFK